MAETRIKVTADTSQAERAIANLERSLGDLQSASADVAKALGVITGAAAAMTYAVLSTADAAGAIIDAANAIGISAQSLQELQYAAGLAGVNAETLNSTILRLNNSIGQGLAKGTGPAVDALKALNLPINDIARLRPDEQFKKISETLLAVENPAQRAALSMELFGKQGPAILAVAQELEKVRKITEEAGLGVTERDLVALDEASDSVDQLKVLWDAGVKKAVAAIAPYVVAIVNKIKEAIKEAGGFEGIWNKIKSILHTVANVMTIIGTILAARLVVGAAQFGVHLAKALVTARGLSAVLARTPIGLLALAIGVAADKMGVDLVGGATEFLDLNLDLKTAEDQINQALDDRNNALATSNELATGFNEEQQKALDSLNDYIKGLENAAIAAEDRNNWALVESKIQTEILKRQKELKAVGLEMAEDKKQEIQDLIRQEEITKRLSAAREKIQSLQLEFAPAVIKEVQQHIENYKKALIDIQNAELSGDKVLIAAEEEKLDLILKNHKKRLDDAIRNQTELGRLETQHKKNIEDVEAAARQFKAMSRGQELEGYRLLQEEKLRLEQEYSEKRLQIEVSRIQRVLAEERSGMAQVLSEKDRAVLQQVGQQERQKAIANERINFEKKSEQEKAQFVIQQGADMFSALGQHNKKAFEAAKAFNIANAIMNTYMGATKALATYPPPFNFIAAAAVIGMGLAQVATIRNQQYSGRQLGGPVMGGTPYLVGENGPELFTPNTTGSITRNSDIGGGSPVSVTFQINAIDTNDFDTLITQRQGVIKQIISDAMLERGQRSMV